MSKDIRIERYTPERKSQWDRFVIVSRQGTFQHLRDYMDYHADRFTDFSLMVFSGNNLIALLPANVEGTRLCSHAGLTFGGWLTSHHVDTPTMLQIFDTAAEYLRGYGIKEVVYKPIPWIYPSDPAEEDIYALFRNNATKVACGVSAVFDYRSALSFNQNSRRNLQKAVQANLVVRETKKFATFWTLLSDVLRHRFNATPVHSLAEITLLAAHFPENIKLYGVFTPQGQMIAGTVLYISGYVAHAQYIASGEEGRTHGALPLLFHTLIKEYKDDTRYFDFGRSTERGGAAINEGLLSQKTGFGARPVCYDTYLWKI